MSEESILLDIVSEPRKAKTGKINPNVKASTDSVVPIDLFISVVTFIKVNIAHSAEFDLLLLDCLFAEKSKKFY